MSPMHSLALSMLPCAALTQALSALAALTLFIELHAMIRVTGAAPILSDALFD
eukprot:m.74768 g.74768  ORF g.74768 m.74768 type:complete len:53 (-) comp7780_c2_seq2:712-870(-)